MFRSLTIICTAGIAILGVDLSTATAAIPAQYKQDYRKGYDSGYSVGYDTGFLTGEQTGITEGTADGNAAGFDKGWDEAYSPAFDAAYNEAYPVGHFEGWDEGVLDGFEDGFNWAPVIAAAINSYGSYDSSGITISTGSGLNWWRGYGSEVHDVTLSLSDTALNNQYDWPAHYFDEGYDVGHDKGIDVGNKDGYKSTYSTAYAIGFDLGYGEGLDEGAADGTSEGNEAGFDNGWDSGYDWGHNEGFYAGIDYALFGDFDEPQYSAPIFARSITSFVALRSAGSGPTFIPEPSSLILIGLMGLAGITRSSRRLV